MLTFIIYILFIHYIADFICQSRWMAINKSSNLSALSIHVLTYTAVLFLATAWYLPVWYILVNGLFHWLTDYCTSRVSSYVYKKEGASHKFWGVIGFDQFIHGTTLIRTLGLI